MVPFEDLDDAQRLDIAHSHPTDLDSSPSSPSSGSPSYLRPRRQSKSATRHRSHTTTDGSTSHLLARLLARDDEVREVKALLVVTSDRLETESTRANTAERRALEYFTRLRSANECRERAEQDSARLGEELRLYKLQLDNAQKEIFRAQDIINLVSAQKNEAEAEAARARTKARKLQEEKMMMLAREEGRRQGYREGLSIGRRLGYDEGTRAIQSSGEVRRRSRQQTLTHTEDDDEDGEEAREELHDINSRSPPTRTRTRTSSHSMHARSESAPPVRTYDTAQHAPTLPVPTIVTPIPVPSPSHAPRPGFTPPPDSPTEEGPETIRPIPYRPGPSSPLRRSPDIPPDGWIPRQDARNAYIPVPPPHELSQPVPPSPSSHSHDLERRPSQSAIYSRADPDYPPVRTRDYAYQAPPLQVPRTGTPSIVSRSSTHVSQYDLVSAPNDPRPGSPLRNEYASGRTRTDSQSQSNRTQTRGENSNHHHRSPAERMVEQWRADPDVVSTATPVFTNTALAPHAGPRRPREIIMPAPLGDVGGRTRAEAAHPPKPVPPPPASERVRSPLDYFRQRFRQREQSAGSIPNIVVESPSESPSNASEHTVTRPELLSPDTANRPVPLPGEGASREPPQQQQQQQQQQPRQSTPAPAFPAGFVPLSEPSTSSQRSQSRAAHRDRAAGERYDVSPVPPGVSYPAPPGRPRPSAPPEDYFSHQRPSSRPSAPPEDYFSRQRSTSPAPLQRPISLFTDHDA
ncbi:hypothetical protein BV22DRAFT_1050814 [Leucogyrophana mollusca]|uniref:Uncharacterized protein n=1 Tax=Leucogyrophana mollusca TaxID=85980 RepID=A0ACB8B2N1_9AGAM|nr:hypothetical protein BV22DRAFT_1050814 [Leucogyrophana mollusca]